MKSTEQIKQEMSKRLQNLDARRQKLEAYASSINKKLGEVRQEIGRLTGAIAALDGEPTLESEVAQASQEHTEKRRQFLGVLSNKQTKFDSDLIPDTPIQAHPTNPRKGMLDGIEIDIPEGMHIGKNSFGEDALIPDGVELPPMAEPLVPANRASTTEILEEFDDPKNLY